MACSAWFCVDDATSSLTARCVRKASISSAPIFQRMSLVVEEDVSLDPRNLCVFRATRVVLQADDMADLVEQFPTPTLHWLGSPGLRSDTFDAAGERTYTDSRLGRDSDRKNSTSVLVCQGMVAFRAAA